uniref:Ig-like domain-containing protein n=1 Tax=Sinocyclocheilus anshuiensis TaxID=1608454 RepID=A0A671LM91_9TELE
SPAGVLGVSELSFSIEPEDVTASLGEPAVLDCQARGESRVAVRWRRNGVHLQESGGVRLLSNGSLYISSSAPADEGFYQCLAHSRHGAVLRGKIFNNSHKESIKELYTSIK